MQSIQYVQSALRRLSLSEPQQAVYLALITGGPANARALAARTNLTRPSVYDQLKVLRQLELVHELDVDGKAQFAAAELKHLEALLDDRIDRLEQSRNALAEALPQLNQSLQTVTPKVRFFEGAEAVKQVLKDVMWHDNETLSVIWNPDTAQKVFETSFLNWFDERRAVRNITIESLWTRAPKAADQPSLTALKTDERRNTTLQTPMCTLVYTNKVALISSPAEAFSSIVESSEYAQLQQQQFAALWKSAKKT